MSVFLGAEKLLKIVGHAFGYVVMPVIGRKHLDLSLVNDCLNIICFTKMNKRSRKV